MGAASFTRRNAANQVGTVFNHLRGMKSTFGTGKTLYYYFRIFVNKEQIYGDNEPHHPYYHIEQRLILVPSLLSLGMLYYLACY